jgi:tetratricopeptide (TPR) repeat protein
MSVKDEHRQDEADPRANYAGMADVKRLVAKIVKANSASAEFAAALDVLKDEPTLDLAPKLRSIFADDTQLPEQRRAAFLALSVLTLSPRGPDLRTRLAPIVSGHAESEYVYERKLTALMLHLDVDPVAELEPVVADSTESGELRYAAFYALNVYHRRMMELSELQDLMRQYSSEFGKCATLSHLQALNYHVQGNLKQARRCAKTAADDLPEHAGALHHYAQVVVDLRLRDASAVHDATLRDAATALDKAITLTNEAYPRYFATLARLLTLQGDYDSADHAIREAIDKEDRSKRDYTLLIGEYQAIRRATELDRSMSRLESQGSGLAREIESIRSESVQMLGLLAAAVAFIVTSTQIASHAASFETGGRLFLLVIGGIIVVFSAFSLTNTLLRGEYLLRALAALAVGTLLLSYTVFFWSPRSASTPAKPAAKTTAKGG